MILVSSRWLTNQKGKKNILELFLPTHPILVEKTTVMLGCWVRVTMTGYRRWFWLPKEREWNSSQEKCSCLKRPILLTWEQTSVNPAMTSLRNTVTLYNYRPTESLWHDFKTGLTNSMDKHIPSKTVTNGISSPWLSQDQECSQT